MNQFFIFSMTLILSAPALAHGPVPGQAAFAAKKVSELLVATEPPSVHERFQSMNVELIGDEMFLVKVSLKGETKTREYQCGLDSTAKPVTWGCKKK